MTDDHTTDELDLLRAWEEPPLDDDARHRTRVALFTAMNEQSSAVGSPRRRTVLRIGLTGAVTAAVAATVLVQIDGERDGQRAGGSPHLASVGAQRVLNGAATWERKHAKKHGVPRDDQFIYSKRIIKETEEGTGKVTSYTDEMWESVDGTKRSLSMELGRTMWEEANNSGGGVWPPRRWRDLKKLPTDPERLVPAIISFGKSDRPISEFDEDERSEAYFMLGELLKWPALPSELRAAAYEGLALVPGVTTVPGMKDSAGRTGVGIGAPKGHFKDKVLIFDPTSYEFLGFRDRRISASGKKSYVQLSHTVDWAIVDKVRQRP
ncbi:CU044_5270 family protein [Streptomyces sp. VRA16 Mangrove soil]|uniref:CU044_5270 family protein n=1 Tax=Streptomyces sp. VRA16 Mangrove soil TaxID=2817434 RepID=UPI001A9E1575|nr:CU044_5270 family protein [Streptomyces sp. VRA16 Mangrove soil]MBO1333365.1 CU044_5270 family protein [Streptomyces sp. VRA16 Mangrove soil]